MSLLRGFFDNDSIFGQLMSRCGIIIAANLLFVFCTIPVVTIGAGYAALYYTMMRCLRSSDPINPFSTFWRGLRENWKQGTLCFLAVVALGVLLYLEQFWCSQFTGWAAFLRYPLMALMVVLAILACYLFPVMAAFQCTLPGLLRNSIFFAMRNPISMVLILSANIVPIVLTYLDRNNLPLYAFLWLLFGFAAITLFNSSLLLRQFRRYLSVQERVPRHREESDLKQQRRTLAEMKKLDM